MCSDFALKRNPPPTSTIPGLCPSTKWAKSMAQRLLERIAQPQVVQGEEIIVSASIGVCFGKGTSSPSGPEALLSNCDSALRRAKEAGRGRVAFFDEGARAATSRRVRIDTGLRRALENGCLELHYQPRIATGTEAIVCFEALMRWTDDELGPIPPGDFIPIAEQSGLIQSIWPSRAWTSSWPRCCWR